MDEALRQYVEGVLRDAKILSLGIADTEGVWVADVTYVYDDELNLYWLSLPTARHSMVGSGAQVACTIHASVDADAERALQIAGTMEVLSEPQPKLLALLNQKIGRDKSYTADELIAGKHLWYKLTPSRIELHHSEPFGWERKTFL